MPADKAGANVGGEIILDTGGREDKWLPYVASDGDGFLVTWTDMRNDANGDGACDVGEGTCWDLGGQFIDGAGALVGANFVISSAPNNQVGGATYAAGRFLLVVNTVENLFGGVIGDVFRPRGPRPSLPARRHSR